LKAVEPTNSHYRPDIDGLRAIAVGLVLLFHAYPRLAPAGFIGVDVFFVISGFLITGILQRELIAGQLAFSLFYARRMRRIVPALAVVTAATWLIGREVYTPDDFELLGKHVLASSGFLSNYLLWRESGYFDTAASFKPLLHLWSLAVEEQFYLLWPVLLWVGFAVARSRGLMLVAAAVTLASFALNLSAPFGGTFTFFAYPTRAWEMGLGALGALAPPMLHPRWRHHALSVLGLGSIVTGVFVIPAGGQYPHGWALFPTLGALSFIAAGPKGLLNRLLSMRAWVVVGLHSYPLYLWHWPLIALSRQSGSDAFAPLCVVLAALLSVLTRAVVESPLQRTLPLSFAKLSTARWTVAGGVAVLCTLATLGALTMTEALFTPIQASVRKTLGRAENATWAEYRQGHCFLAGGEQTWRSFPPECETPPTTGGPRVLVWGDSYAASMFTAIEPVVVEAGGSMVGYAASACPPVLDAEIEHRSNCREANNFVFDVIRQDHFTTVVLASNWLGSYFRLAKPPSLQALDSTIARIHQAGVKNVIVVGQFPTWRASLPGLVMREMKRKDQALPKTSGDWLDSTDLFALDDTLRERLESRGEKYFSPLRVACPERRCGVFVDDRHLWSFDNGHPTRAAADRYVEQLKPWLLLRESR